ncbi:MAG: hypothetical protein AAB582_02135 [Patescibacteria group bacterium]
MGFLKVGAFALFAFGIALYSLVQKPAEPKVAVPQVASASLAPVPVSVSVEGTIVFDNAPASDVQPYVRYSQDGTSPKTKRLVLPTQYACMQGDIPCSAPLGVSHPFKEGDRVRIEGTADADLLYVHSIQINR